MNKEQIVLHALGIHTWVFIPAGAWITTNRSYINRDFEKEYTGMDRSEFFDRRVCKGCGKVEVHKNALGPYIWEEEPLEARIRLARKMVGYE